MTPAEVSLDDRYRLERGRVYVTGIQALVRLTLDQRRRDAARGLDTAGFVSGYRGSPLGGLDQALWQAGPILERNRVEFHPAINEDLGATAVWGSQQVGLFPGARHAGVFGLWYGKGPGVDRSGDVFKHANAAGVSRHGGVLAVAGDDHACKSSTLPSQSEYSFMDAQMPVLNPAGVQEVLDLGLLGFELSRFSGCWVGFKAIAETMDSSASIDVDPGRLAIVQPEGVEVPPGGLHIRWPDRPLEQEERLHRHKLYAALAFARANRLDRTVIDGPGRRLGIVTAGKSYLDVRQALADLGIDESMANAIGLTVYKVAMSWPLERDGIRGFAEGLEEVLVVEEKRAVIENQLKEQLYNWRADVRPRVVGKFDERGEWLLPSTGELTPARIARVLAARIGRFFTSEHIEQRLRFLERKEAALARPRAPFERTPHFCSGCPHNTSTVLPEGSRAFGGIGCHYMATWMDRGTETFTQMGGEGVPWIGQAPFTETGHVFANLGDGTYFHSGLLAIRAAVAAGVNITYKLLYNEAVAMTGGQPIDGHLGVARITRQLEGEGVARIEVLSDDPSRHAARERFAGTVGFHHRDRLDAVQRELREVEGVSVLIYDQTCATEKRRRRKRGKAPAPVRRAFINEAVCEGCGDCAEQSNCLAIVPVETALGRKRAIDQDACNTDLSCLRGFCPSFVTVTGATPRRARATAPVGAADDLPEPLLPAVREPYGIVVTGVGGNGVTTVAALLGMAAHLEGKGCSVLDMTGLAQKHGAVVSHVRIAARPESIQAVRISAGNARLLLGCDVVVAAGFEALGKCDAKRTRAVVNAHQSMPAAFVNDPDLHFPGRSLHEAVEAAVSGADFVDATRLSRALLGDTITANLFLLGVAWQRGLVPLTAAAIERAIEINAVAVEANRCAFAWGRRFAHDPGAVHRAAGSEVRPIRAETLTSVVEHRAALLVRYQGEGLARRYRELVDRVAAAEAGCAAGSSGLALAAAKGYATVLAYKDEYEIARLYGDGELERRLSESFEGDFRVEVHLAPPLLSRPDPATGRARKRAFGPWILRAMRLLARLRGLRGTPFDPFGYSAERRMERQLVEDYEATIVTVLENLDRHNHATAVALASLPLTIRGFGPVKHASVARARARHAELLALLETAAHRQAA